MEVKTTLLRIVYKALCDSADGNPVRWALMCYTAAQQVLTVFVRPSVRPLACTSTLKHKLTPFRTLSLTLVRKQNPRSPLTTRRHAAVF